MEGLQEGGLASLRGECEGLRGREEAGGIPGIGQLSGVVVPLAERRRLWALGWPGQARHLSLLYLIRRQRSMTVSWGGSDRIQIPYLIVFKVTWYLHVVIH